MPNSEERNEHTPVQEEPTVPVEETPAETPAETPIETPAETPAEAPAEAPAEVPAEAPAEEKKEETKEAPACYYERYTVKKCEQDEETAKRRKHLRQSILAGVLAFSVLVVTLFGGALLGRLTAPILPGAGATTRPTTTTQGGGSGTGNQPTIDRGDLILNVVERAEGEPAPGSIAAVAASVRDAVVDILITQTVVDFVNGNSLTTGEGSGVLISADNAQGLILTCAHVIEGADVNGITVTLMDGRVFSGTQVEVLGEDSWSDLALLRIREKNGSVPANLTYATLATSGSASDYSYLTLGETAIAIGNSLGEFSGSVTSGVISGVDREINLEGQPMTLLQTDAPTSPGNSGGGLFNMAGELIGITNAGYNNGAVEGISLAIPSCDAIPIIGELYTQGYVSGRPYLGLYMRVLGGQCLVVDYLYNSELPEVHQLMPGDIITQIDGKNVTTSTAVRSALGKVKVGEKVSVTIVRIMAQKQLTFTVDLLVHEYTR